jgi:ABC-type Fe3+-hydroxamate transport system substrate-binding protein
MDYTFQNAIEQAAGKGKIRIKAVTFQQGEAEAAISEAVANAYYQTGTTINAANPLPYFFQQLRAYHPLLSGKKVYITKVYTTAGGYPYISNVATRQTAYVSEIGNSELLSMDGSVVFADAGVHWDAVTQEIKATNIYNLIKDN